VKWALPGGVIFDRRSAERRDVPLSATPDRRRHERRGRPAVEEELRTVGYAFLVLD